MLRSPIARLLPLALAILLAAPSTAVPQEGDGVPAADWLAVGPRRNLTALGPLVEHRREQGLRVATLALEDLAEARPSADPVERLREVVRQVDRATDSGLRFLLIAGDVPDDDGPGVPTGMVETEVGPTATDLVFSLLDDDELPDLAVGRIPGDRAEVRRVVRRTLDYERSLDAGEWQRDVAFVAGPGRFGPGVDRMLEDLFADIITETIPGPYDVDMTYANPSSAYCYPPNRFAERVSGRLTEGALVFAYVGHGASQSVDTVRWRGEAHDVLTAEQAARTEVAAGSPVTVMIACSTGQYDLARGDCVGEALLEAPGGVVSFVGSSRVSQPYANAVLAYELVRRLLDREVATVGEALLEAKRAMASSSDDAIRTRIDSMAQLFLPPPEQVRQRREHLALYNLLGDPAVRIRRPAELTAEIPSVVREGGTLRVRGRADDAAGAEVRATLEVERTVVRELITPPDPSDPDAEERFLENYRIANDKVVADATTRVGPDGTFELEVPVPDDPLEPVYLVKLVLTGPGGTRVTAGRAEVAGGQAFKGSDRPSAR